MRTLQKTLLQALDRLPPNVCRLLARKKHGWIPLTHSEIAKKSGLPLATVADLSLKTSWRGVTVEVLQAFSMACGVDHLRSSRQIEYLKRRKLIHLTRGDGNQRRMFKKLMGA